MAPSTATLSLLLFLSATVSRVAGLSQSYCSSLNTGSGNGATFWQYQSNGWCHDHCNGNYAFAIVQGSNCWCSDYAPANTVDVGKCNDVCPGFGDESCGKQSDGLFGYIQLDKKAVGTVGGSSPSSSQAPVSSSTPSRASSSATPSSSSSSSSSPSPSTSSQQASSSSPSSSSSSSPSSPSSSSSPSHSPSSSWTPTPITSIQIITESGAAVTKTVTFIPTSPSGQLAQTSKGGVSSGVIAGAVIGSLAGLAAIIGLLVWLLAYRRRQNKTDGDFENGGLGGAAKNSPQRHASTMSKAGLLRSEKQYPTVAIPGVRRHSSGGTEGVSPMSGSQPSNPERRHSRPLFYDQRLNPSALMDLDNGSHTSILTIEDNRDYTRTLNVRNPDPHEG